jgi:hypothetical protein
VYIYIFLCVTSYFSGYVRFAQILHSVLNMKEKVKYQGVRPRWRRGKHVREDFTQNDGITRDKAEEELGEVEIDGEARLQDDANKKWERRRMTYIAWDMLRLLYGYLQVLLKEMLLSSVTVNQETILTSEEHVMDITHRNCHVCYIVSSKCV